MQIHSVLISLLKFHAPSAAGIDAAAADDSSDLEDADAPPPPTFPPGTLKIVPQLLLGGNVTPAQDLSAFLKQSPNVLIGTPGRLLSLLASPHVHCPQSSFDALVLDEADRLLDLGFKEDLQKILGRLPKQRRTGLFSASVSEAVDQLIRVGLRYPVRIAVKVKAAKPDDQGSTAQDKRTPASLQLSYLVAPASHRLPAIQKLLAALQPPPQKAIVYLATCYAVDYFQHILPLVLPGYAVVPLHGKQIDKVRRKNFARFVDAVSPALLVTTDVAARGLDIPAVDLVLQLDAPSDPKTFIHRCGRAGRAGRKGLAVTFLTPGREEDYVEFLRVRQTPITPLSSPSITTSPADAAAVTRQIRNLVRTDRALYDKAQRGFVSSVRAYSKHTASSIFRVLDLQWEDLGHAWGLLRLPAMPELKKFDGDRALGLAIDFDALAYKDKVREKQRLAELAAAAAAAAENGEAEKKHGKKREAPAWSQKTEQRVTKEARREKRSAKREAERVAKLTDEERKKEEELQRMIQQVRKTVVEDEDNAEFEGFSD